MRCVCPGIIPSPHEVVISLAAATLPSALLPPGLRLELVVERQEQGVRVEGLGQKAGDANFTQLSHLVVAGIAAVNSGRD